MYKHGRPARSRTNLHIFAVILLTVATIMAAGYLFLVRPTNNYELRNDTKPLVTNIEHTDGSQLVIDEPLYTMTLPGEWKVNNKNPHAGYNNVQWNYTGANSGGRWLRLYIDTIPQNFMVNYLMPVAAEGSRLNVQQMSDNCVSFTQNATGNSDRDAPQQMGLSAVPARWQKVNFLCDNSHVSHQVVGTGSSEGINTVSVAGPKHGKHRYFFVYRDDNFRPDYSIFNSILASFRAK